MDFHVQSLAKLCRLCGGYVKSSKSLSPKEKYSELLLKIYGISVAEDEQTIHPPKLCAPCRLRMTRYEQAGGVHPGTVRSLAVFTPHQEGSCPICSQVGKPSTTYSSTSTATVTSASNPAQVPPQEQASTSQSSSIFIPIKSKTPVDVTKNLFAPPTDSTQKGKKWLWTVKDNLNEVGREYGRKRVKEASDFVSEFCESKNEDETDLLFFLLQDNLFKAKDARYKHVSELWNKVESSGGLTVDDCLAMRVGLLETKGKYAEQYQFFKAKGENILKPPNALDVREPSYMPGSARFGMMDVATYIHHTPVKPQNIQMDNIGGNTYEPQLIEGPAIVRELAEPNCLGVIWSYREAVAKTLEELDLDIAVGLAQNGFASDDPSIVLQTTIKDGADGMGDIAVHKSASDTYLPDKAFRASFAILKCEVVKEDKTRVTVFEEGKPNSVQVNRPIFEAIGDENSKSTSAKLLRRIECERNLMQGQTMKIYTASSTRLHRLKIFNSMIDEKLDRADGGLQGSGSKYLCTLCHATRETAKSELGTFHIDRTYGETADLAKYVEVNPDKLSQAELADIAKGVKGEPILLSDPKMKLLDATHADINLGQFLKKLIVRETAGLQVWEARQDVKEYFDDAEKRLNDHVRATIGLAPSLMMPGNYARELFDPANELCFLALVASEDRKEHLRSVLKDFRSLRKFIVLGNQINRTSQLTSQQL